MLQTSSVTEYKRDVHGRVWKNDTRVREHLSYDKSSLILKHLQSSERCRQSCSADCFEILDSAPTKFQLKLKEAMHINWAQFKSTSSSRQPGTYTLGF